MRRRPAVVLAVCVFVGLAVGCQSTGGYGTGASFSGRVVDPQQKPIAGARVDVNGRETVSGADGKFQLAVRPAATYALDISHRDYAGLTYLSRTGVAGQDWVLVPAQVESADPTQPITLVDRRPGIGVGGATFELPANALVDPRGNPPASNVRALIATLDVSNGEGPNNWAVRSDDGQQEGFLVSYGAVFVEFTDPGGNTRYQIRSGQTGKLTLPVLPNMTAHAPSNPSARFWYYDENDDYWKRTGNATFDPVKGAYVGTVDHLSFLNTDIAKFDAACLKMTLHPSVPPGNRIRIRYHSGGTPFGQTPNFIMNNVDNAAYRLPANTNVLLELLDATNEVFGNLVVEDPPGMDVVNAVVNTGAAIPPGGDLWPPPPYATCHAVVLKLGAPQVEIRINELPADVLPRDNPTDDYVTWAPTFARARLSPPMMAPVNIVLTNDAAGAIAGGGDVNFANYVAPWPVNTTATASTLSLTLPADGSWVSFVVAGKFGTPSRNDKDTIIEAHQNTAAGPILGTKALMVRVRKNANDLWPEERDRFLFAWQKFRNAAGPDNYIFFQEMHRLSAMAGDESHMQPAFLSWHRAMLLHVERELQKHEPSVSLHYWDWDAAAPNLFHQDFIGAPGPPGFVAEPQFSMTNPLNGWNTDLPFSSGTLSRNTLNHTLDPGGAMKDLVDMIADWDDYGLTTNDFFSVNSFSDDVERSSHNNAHGWPCAGGQLNFPNRSAADPLFYLLHSQIDREWAAWQEAHNRHGVVAGGVLTFPAPAHYDNNNSWNTPGNVADANFRQRGAFLNDGLWPWDGTTDGPSGTAQSRPPNQGGGPLDENLAFEPEVIPDSLPLIPGTAFPASVRRNLWPPAAVIPTNAHMIDYLGKFRPQDGLGFCYDDVDY